jgi:putative oxidoreductase
METDDRSTGMWPRRVARLLSHLLRRAGVWTAPPVLRIALALPFFRSGLTRWDSFLSISQGTIYLFEEQFKLHIFGHQYPFPLPDACAYVVGTVEIVFPILIILGLGTRFVGAGLFIMTGVIQLTYPDGWANFHLYWAAIALAIMAVGPGPLSCDWLIRKLTDAAKARGRIMPGGADIQSSSAQ